MHGRGRVTPDTAVRFAQELDTTPELWLNLQGAVDIFDAKQQLRREIERRLKRRAAPIGLRTPGRRSQTDLLAFVKLVHGTAVIAVEGKVDESFDDLVSTWNDHSPGKERRLQALCATLGLRVADVGGIRYQLLHRTASAIYEAQRYRTLRAVMLVHSFSLTDASFHDFQAFAKSMGVPVQTVNRVSEERQCEGIRLRLAWVKDQPIK